MKASLPQRIARHLLACVFATLDTALSCPTFTVALIVLVQWHGADAYEFVNGCVFDTETHMGPSGILSCGLLQTNSEIKNFITQHFGDGSWENGKEVASNWGVRLFQIAFGKDMWVLRAAVGNMVLQRAFSLSFIQFSKMMCRICWKAENLALGKTDSEFVLHPLETELLGITMAMNLIGGDGSKFAWATRSSLFDEDSALLVAHVLMFCMLTALINPRTRKQCLEGDPFLAACFYGAYFIGAVLLMDGEDLVTLAVVGDPDAYRPVVAFMRKMQDGLGPRFIPRVMALLWKAYHEEGWTVGVQFMSNDKGRETSPWLLWKPSAVLKGFELHGSNQKWLGVPRATYLIIRNLPEYHLLCIAGAMLANVGVWDASKCLPPPEPLANDRFLVTVVRAFVEFFWWVKDVTPKPEPKPKPDPNPKPWPPPPPPTPWLSLMLGLPFRICIMHEDGRFEYATPYDTIEQIVNQWGDAPTRANVLARHRSLASLRAFGAVSLNDLRRAAGVGTASHPRMN